MISTAQRLPEEKAEVLPSIAFVIAHLVPLAAFWTGITTTSVILCVSLYVIRMFFITAGYHRYFAHRSYKTNRVFQTILAIGGATAAQKGPLWWAGHHRLHHRYSDTERDVHSPIKGVLWSHIGWIFSPTTKETPPGSINDFEKFPELRFINRHDGLFPWALALTCLAIDGWSGLVVGFFWSTVLVWHGTFLVNSAAHLWGRRRYATTDTSRNSALIALVTLGEGWHNNHHYYPASARQGFMWWEYDVSYYVLRMLSWVGVVSDLKVPPAKVRSAALVRDGAFDVGMFRAYWRKATVFVGQSRHAAADRLADGRDALGDTAAAARDALDDIADVALARASEVAKLTRRLAPTTPQPAGATTAD